MIVDGLLLILVNRLCLRLRPPHRLMGVAFYGDARPVKVSQHLFASARRGASFPAIVPGALIDLIIRAAIASALLSYRARRKASA